MNKRRQFLSSALVGFVALMGSGAALAAESAAEFSERTSAEMVAIIEAGQAYHETDPERLQAEIGGLLDRIVDFNGIARGVMGKHHKVASDGQKSAFAKTFRDSLVKAYSQALVGFGEMNIEVVGAKGPSDKKQSVDLLASSASGTQVTVRYSMAAKKPGQWQIRNMIIEGINLGQTYRSQFASSMSQNGGDMDAVIAGWSAVEVEKK